MNYPNFLETQDILQATTILGPKSSARQGILVSNDCLPRYFEAKS